MSSPSETNNYSECQPVSVPLHCPACHGVGFVETPRIKCIRCEGNPRGCYQCTGGYIQYAWTECDQCFLLDLN